MQAHCLPHLPELTCSIPPGATTRAAPCQAPCRTGSASHARTGPASAEAAPHALCGSLTERDPLPTLVGGILRTLNQAQAYKIGKPAQRCRLSNSCIQPDSRRRKALAPQASDIEFKQQVPGRIREQIPANPEQLLAVAATHLLCLDACQKTSVARTTSRRLTVKPELIGVAIGPAQQHLCNVCYLAAVQLLHSFAPFCPGVELLSH